MGKRWPSHPRARLVAIAGWLALCALVPSVSAQGTGGVPGGEADRGGYTVERWGVEDGLPVLYITSLAQEPNGYLWLSTSDGVVRFDGRAFTVFDAASTAGLATSRQDEVAVASDGAVWTRYGTTLTRLAGGAFEPIAAEDSQGRAFVPLAMVQSIVSTGGDTFALSEDGLWVWHGGRLQRVRPDAIQGPVRGVLRDRGGRLWASTDRGVVRVSPGKPVRLFRAPPATPFARSNPLVEDRAGAIWMASDYGAYRLAGGRFTQVGGLSLPSRLDAQAWAPVPDFDPSARVAWQMGRGPDGAAWVLSWGHWYAEREGRLVRQAGRLPGTNTGAWPMVTAPDGSVWWSDGRWLYHGYERVLALDENVQALEPDGRGGVWVAADGLVRVRPRPVRMAALTVPGSPNTYPVLQTRDGGLWAGVWGPAAGLVRLGRDPEAPPLPSALHQSRDGALWIGALNGLWRRADTRTGTGAAFVPLPDWITRGHQPDIHAVLETADGRLWVASALGLVVGAAADASGPSWTSYPLAHPVLALVETRAAELLVGSRGRGLGRHLGGGRFEWLGTAGGLASDNVRDVYEDDRGVLWIATEDRGLCRLDRGGRAALSSGRLACFGDAEGLYDLSLHRILPDDDGRLWISSNRGIFWIDRDRADAVASARESVLLPVAYGERDGLASREANGARQPAGVRLADGRLAFPTQAGLALIDPAMERRPSPVPVRIEEATSPEGALPTRAVASGRVRLAAGVRDVVIDYAGVEFDHPGDVRYRVRLDGYHDGWRDVDDRREATYTNLPPGTHSFRVQAGLGGAWGPEATLTVVAEPFAWETPWARVLAVLAALALGWAAVRARTRSLRARQAELEHTVEARTAELRRANGVKTRFLANVSHELRTPLTLLLGPVADLRDRADDPGTRAILDRAAVNGDRLRRLIDDLLALARLEADADGLAPVRDDLSEFVRRRVAAFDSQAAAAGIDLAVDAPAPVWLAFDPSKIETVVYNVVANAVKFTPPGGRVRVAVRAERGGATLAVADTGLGVGPGDLEHLFERFYQADTPQSRVGEGAGIGLALAREVVALHGGTIAATSEPGEGTTVTVWLPAGPSDAPRSDASPPLTPQTVESGSAEALDDAYSDGADPDGDCRPLVLVVEDHPDLRAYLGTILGETYRVAKAADGASGLSRAVDLVPDLVLSDVMMPGVDGFALLAALKGDVRTSHIPVVLLTARADAESRLAGFGAGADDYLAKPFESTELRARLAALLANRERLRQAWASRRAARAETPPAAADSTPSQTAPPEPVLPKPAPPETELSGAEAAFVARVEALTESHLASDAFGAAALAEALRMSPRQLRRKLDALTGETPGAYVRRARVERAAALLAAGEHSVKEVGFAVGFSSASGFRRAFGEVVGESPAAFAERPAR